MRLTLVDSLNRDDGVDICDARLDDLRRWHAQWGRFLANWGADMGCAAESLIALDRAVEECLRDIVCVRCQLRVGVIPWGGVTGPTVRYCGPCSSVLAAETSPLAETVAR